jgi:shikimate kinase
MRTEIVLIGPVRTGKSTQGRLLAEKLGLPQVSLDVLREQYYQEIGFDPLLAKEIRQKGGFLALMFYRELFAAYAVERLLAEHHDCVIDFGAGIYESDEMFARVQKALADYANVVLLLPSADIDESRRILAARDANPPADLTFDLNARFLKHHTYYDLARITVYTQGKTPEETCQEILERVKGFRNHD